MRFVIRGGRSLKGKVYIQGSKNSALPILAASALAHGESIIENIPAHSDILTMCHILRELGVNLWVDEKRRLHVDATDLTDYRPSHELARRIRGSFYVAGMLLARLGTAEVPLPGGCAIGSRSVDYHIKGFEQLGADVSIEHGNMVARAATLTGTKVFINRASVGATVNMILASSLANGVTIIENAAKEPEIVDLCIFMNAMGAKIRGAGTEIIKIQGVDRLRPVEYSIISDRIEAGTFMCAVGAAGGDVTIENVVPEHLRTPISKLQEAGIDIETSDSTIRVRSSGELIPVDMETAVYPGFPTDLQQPFVAMMATAAGTSVVRETVFSDRFRYVDELVRMGANIKVEQDTAIVRGVERLTGAPVEVPDLRAGAAMVIAALAAQGETELSKADIIERGYEDFDGKLRALGADIERDRAAEASKTLADDLFQPLRPVKSRL